MLYNTPQAVQAALHVSRETMERLELYVALLAKWQARINLVGPKTLPEVWHRHIFDSAQLWPLIPPTAKTLVDLGSGAGFPGLVLAILGVPAVHLIESDQRKAAFLREVARQTAASVTIHATRIEKVPPIAADVVSARALASLSQLLELATPFLAPHTICLFPKGQNVEAELTDLHKIWHINTQRVASLTDSDAVILRLSEVSRHDSPRT